MAPDRSRVFTFTTHLSKHSKHFYRFPSPLSLYSLGPWILLVFIADAVQLVSTTKSLPNMTLVGCIRKSCYFLNTKPASWESARDHCTSFNNTYLTRIRDETTFDLIKDTAEESGVELWLGAKEKLYPRWRWLSDISFYGDIHLFYDADNTNKPYCGVLNTANNLRLEGSSCSELKRFVCASTDIEHVRQGDHFISESTQRESWFKARETCRRKGMDLVSGSGNDTGFIYQILIKESGIFWIGLTKSRYQWDSDGSDMLYTRFGSGQPNKASQLCLAMSSGGEYIDEECNKMKQFTCEWVNTTIDPLIIDVGNFDYFLDISTLIIGVTIGGGFLIVIIGMICVCLLVRRLKSNKDKGRQSPVFPDTGNLYNTTIAKPNNGDTEIVYDVTNQFHFIKNNPATLTDEKPAAKKNSSKFNFFQRWGRSNTAKETSTMKEGFDTVLNNGADVYQNDVKENVYQNSQAALPHYQNKLDTLGK